MKYALFLLKTSRPGLWFQTVWLYMLPTSHLPICQSTSFWAGLVYVTFPLNLLVYGWNDLVDQEGDLLNPRKGTFLFGAQGSNAELSVLPYYMLTVQLPFLALFTAWTGWNMALLFLVICGFNWVYNLPRTGWRGRPPLELLNQLGYLLILPLSMWLNDTPSPSCVALGYLVMFCTHSHLMGEVMDFIPDEKVNRWTTARYLGVYGTKALIVSMVFTEGLLMGWWFKDWILGGFLLLGCIWLLLDMFVLFKDRPYYNKVEITLFGLGINAAGLASMTWVWLTGTLMR